MLHHMILGMLGRGCGNPYLQIIWFENLLHKANYTVSLLKEITVSIS